jgi:hypothetical protein
MQLHIRLALSLCLLAAARLGAQNTQPSFENDQVIIDAPHPGVDVPGSTHKMHDHKLNRVMVYLHPGGEVLHYRDGSTVDLKWQQGEVKWSPASGLHYSVIPPELDPRVWKKPAFTGPMIVDIGIKKAGSPGKVVTSALDPLRVDPKDFQLVLENSQVRVLRVRMGPRGSAAAHELVRNSLLVWITGPKAGEFTWRGPFKGKLENPSDTPLEAVIVELKN